MIKKVLIANRGEIAVRIIRSCKEIGVQTVAIFSNADRESLHVKLADEAYCIGPKESEESYLNISKIITVAKVTSCDAIHPGYGFLAENADFVELCEETGIEFIGPASKAIKQMGTKDVARRAMKEAGIPVVPGSDSSIASSKIGLQEAEKIGYPLILKAVAGGGGKGIRVVENENDFINAFNVTQEEARKAFNNSKIYIEKYIEDFRHIEVQVLADKFGNVIHLGERDCTIQRRMQKIIEETPSPILSERTREKMGEAAVKAAEVVGYHNAGTVEFIYDRNNGEFYFMEMNTRIQVEHPITEVVNNIDIITEQIKMSNNQKLSYSQEDIDTTQVAMECRINAEDPDKNFMPSIGKIESYLPPGGYGVRVDSFLYHGYSIVPFYDSMLSKIITQGRDRKEAIERMKRALAEYEIEGIKTNIAFVMEILNNKNFLENDYNTNFISK